MLLIELSIWLTHGHNDVLIYGKYEYALEIQLTSAMFTRNATAKINLIRDVQYVSLGKNQKAARTEEKEITDTQTYNLFN